ncbi:MAG: zinc ABC transporter solute-binding protein [Chloroflexaceae bacterium]|nr:zinc ABC transporter solute-binding protein [Chloroflexaceae bacterium]
MIHRLRWMIMLVGITLMGAACGAARAPVPAAPERLRVLVTTQQIGDAVQNVAGEQVELVMLLGPGIDPHTYIPTESDLRKFEQADVIFANGLHLEAQMDRVLAQLATREGKTVVQLGDQLDSTNLLSWEPEAGLPYDPHVWNDVRLWKEVVAAIATTLAEVDPSNAATYQANATTYAAELDALHAYLLAQADTIPAEQRILVTAHDAFGYFGRAYGFEVEAVQGLSTEAEASAADIQELAQIIIAGNVPAIFIETTISPRTIEAVQAAVQDATGKPLLLGGELYSDAMGAPGSGTDTYIGMMRHNIDTIVAALGA